MKRAFRKKFRPSWPQRRTALGVKPKWKPEFSDGCSFVKDYPETSHCCGGWGGHDEGYYYARGGWRGRMTADREYRECMLLVASKLPEGKKRRRVKRRAWVRWLGVRMGGWIAWYT